MNLPSAEQYLEIVENKAFGKLATLNHHRFILNQSTGSYLFHRSAKAIVLKSEYLGNLYAVRFFLKDDPELFGRYVQAQAYLKDKTLPWLVQFDFLDKEFYPALKMQWTDSLSFTEYLDEIIGDQERINKLQQDLVQLSCSLEENKTGHGNLNLQHIRFERLAGNYRIRLIDYDSIYVPVFERRYSLAAGSPGFQHPRRLASDFSPTVDRFTFWIFLTALESFKTDPELWKNIRTDAQTTGQLLFSYRDLAFPEQSATFQLLKTYNNPALQFYCDRLLAFCRLTSLAKIEAPSVYQPNFSVPVTETKTTGLEQPQLNKEPIRHETREAAIALEHPQERAGNQHEKNTGAVSVQVRQIPAAVSEKPAVANTRIPVMTIEKPVERETVAIPQKTPPNLRPLLVSAAVVLILVAAYFAWPKHTREDAAQQGQPVATKSAPANTPAPAQQPANEVTASVEPKQTEFTSANLTQFLFQLYHSYNKRDLPAILSRYGDKVQYYDAGSVTKQQLNGILDDLFIKPAYYECQPDLRTLSFQQQDGGCTINLTVKETIKPNARSKPEKYTSTLEYRLDKSFHIVSEKRIS